MLTNNAVPVAAADAYIIISWVLPSVTIGISGLYRVLKVVMMASPIM